MDPRFKKVRHCTFFKQDFQSPDAPAIGSDTVLWHNPHTELKHQVNLFRTICTVCGFVALS
ncbi:hypothetical protein BC456_05290 [Neisseria meningitidis]|nr:hypothetical protein BC456_05290 [Neisseria meningitidis]